MLQQSELLALTGSEGEREGPKAREYNAASLLLLLAFLPFVGNSDSARPTPLATLALLRSVICSVL